LLGAVSGRFPLLVKVLFPFDKLSVQVHPDDQKAQQLSGEPTGKTECWYVLDAQPGASVALGLNPGVSAADVRRGIDDGTLEDLLRIVPLEKGDLVYVDAGTVHAIYPGAVLLETQQNSDLTYRLYDFGRGRELHLDDGLAAMRIKTAAGKVKPQTSNGNAALIESEYFRIDSFFLEAGKEAVALAEHLAARSGVPAILFVAAGGCSLQVEGGQFLLHQGQVAVVPQRSGTWKLQAEEACQLICMTPGRP
jgi:mannose-6-phosphate isomerase